MNFESIVLYNIQPVYYNNFATEYDRYTCEEELLDDLRLMFNNCRQYNEEGSIIYDDANILERVLLDKARELGLASAAAAKPKRY